VPLVASQCSRTDDAEGALLNPRDQMFRIRVNKPLRNTVTDAAGPPGVPNSGSRRLVTVTVTPNALREHCSAEIISTERLQMASHLTLMARTEATSAADLVVRADAGGVGLAQKPERGGADSETADDRPMTIGEVAQQFGITLRALRFYEAKRLIFPQRHGAMRLYRRSERERLALILTGRKLGFTLAEIGELLDRPDSEGLRLTREQCVAQINLLEQQKRSIDVAIAELRQICTAFYRKLLDAAEQRSG